MFSSGHSDAVQYGDFMRSTDAGVTWTAITGFKEVHAWGYGEPLTVGAYPSILAAGWFNGVFGYWRSYDNAVTWQSISTIVPGHDFDYCSAIAGKWGTTKRGHFVVCFHGSGAAAGIPV